MTYKQQIQQVQNALNYLIAEGLAIEDGEGLYRLKTNKELEADMEAIHNE
jgi:hypothetical protein